MLKEMGKKYIEKKCILSFHLIFACPNRFYSLSFTCFASCREISDTNVWIVCSVVVMFFSMVLFVFILVELWAAAKRGDFPWIMCCSLCRSLWYSDIAGLQGVLFGGNLVGNFFSPVSFQLDQLTDPATSDAVGSLDLTWGKWWVYSTTG